MDNLDHIFHTAQTCANLASKMCLEFKHGFGEQSLKKDKTWVTAADTQIEHELRKIILKNHPTHFILGEEQGGGISESEEDYTWVLDPIDGTFSFVHNIPFYSSLIAVLKGKKPVVGFACLPAMGITMSAALGKGAFINGEKYIRPALVGSSHIELVALADIYRFFMANKQGVLSYFLGADKKMRTYSDGLGYYLLLNGSVRAFVDPKVEIWDVAPFHIILPEAGFAIHAWGENRETCAHLVRGTSIAYPVDENNMPINCEDILKLVSQFS